MIYFDVIHVNKTNIVYDNDRLVLQIPKKKNRGNTMLC